MFTSCSTVWDFFQKQTVGKAAVIRYARFSEEKQPEKFCCRLLKLYMPHRFNAQLKPLKFPTYEQFYKCASVELPTHPGILIPVRRYQEHTSSSKNTVTKWIRHLISCNSKEHLKRLGWLLQLKLKWIVWSALQNEKTSIQMMRMYKMMSQSIRFLNMEMESFHK